MLIIVVSFYTIVIINYIIKQLFKRNFELNC